MHAVWKVDAVNHVEEVMSGQKKCRAQRIVGIETRLTSIDGLKVKLMPFGSVMTDSRLINQYLVRRCQGECEKIWPVRRGCTGKGK